MRAVEVYGKNGKVKVNVVSEILGEKGTDRTVDHAGSKDSLFGGLTLTLEVAAGNAAYCVKSLLKVNAEGKEVDTVAGSCACGSASKNCGVAVANKAASVSKACHLSHFYGKRSACKGVMINLVILKHF